MSARNGRDISQLKPLSLTHPLICNTHSLSNPHKNKQEPYELERGEIGEGIEEDGGEEEGKHQQQPMDTLHPSTPSW
jgi:hypothetical protein